MDSDLTLDFIIIVVLIIANGLFSMTELAIVNAKKRKLEEMAEAGNERAKKAFELAENPNNMFSTIQIGITLVGILTGLYSGATFSGPLEEILVANIPSIEPYAASISSLLIVAIITYLSLVIGELVPKRLALNSPESIAVVVAKPIYWLSVALKPIVSFLGVSTEFLLKLLGVTVKEEAPVTESEINKMLTEGVAMGADKGVLLTDRVLGGSDTCATSIALAAALKKVGFDLVIAGRQAIDGDTAQVGPQTAERLDIPQITYVDEILEVKEDSITVKRSLEDVEQIVTAKLPCVITTLSGMNKPRYMQCDNIVDLCKEDKIEVLTNAELGIDPETVGFKGSPTSVKTTFTKDVTDKTEVFTLSEQETADMIAKTLKEKQIITK